MDEKGALFDILNDRGQLRNVADQHPDLASKLRVALNAHRLDANKHFVANADRPFSVGYAGSTTLPARDGIPHGTITRSSKAPNNSFFKNWTSQDDSITWDIKVGKAGAYRATVFYTCPAANVGGKIRLKWGNSETEATVTEPFDPPLWDKSKERVSKSHYFVKDFKPLDLGILILTKGRDQLTLTAPQLVANHGIDVYSIVLDQVQKEREADLN